MKAITGVLLSLALGCISGASWIDPALAQTDRALTIRADRQEANANTGVISAIGNVTITYLAEQVTAQAQKATYFTEEQRIVLEGQVLITQEDNRLQAEKVTYMITSGTIEADPVPGQQVESIYVLPEPAASPEQNP